MDDGKTETGGAVGSTVPCWSCGAAAMLAGACPACDRLQPFAPGVDHWAVLGLDRRLGLAPADLERRFHALNRRFHPDYHRLRSPREQAISLENAAAVNTAYRTLRDPAARAEYILDRHGMGLDTERSRPPADLFEEIMEIQEARQELLTAGPDEAAELRLRLAAVRAELQRRRAEAEAALPGLFARWDGAAETERTAVLAELRALLARRAYLRTVLRDLEAALGSDELAAGAGGGRTHR